MAIWYVRIRRNKYELHYFPSPRPYLPSSLLLTHPSHPIPFPSHPDPYLTTASKDKENPRKRSQPALSPSENPVRPNKGGKEKTSQRKNPSTFLSPIYLQSRVSRCTLMGNKKCNGHLCFWLKIYVCSARCSESLRKSLISILSKSILWCKLVRFLVSKSRAQTAPPFSHETASWEKPLRALVCRIKVQESTFSWGASCQQPRSCPSQMTPPAASPAQHF